MTRRGAALRNAIGLTKNALDEVRRSVTDLRAAPLEGLTLGEAVRRLVEQTGREHGLKVQFDLRGADRPLSPRMEMGVFRIAQEALTNAVNHAEARSLTVSLDLGEGLALQEPLRLEIEDDGRGFNPAEPPAGHFGLLGMRERARLLGGTLEIASAPGAGTRITLELPAEG